MLGRTRENILAWFSYLVRSETQRILPSLNLAVLSSERFQESAMLFLLNIKELRHSKALKLKTLKLM
jgi:hypothetical protein